MITFEVLIADLAEALEQPTAASILELEKTGKLSFFTRLKLASLEEQTAIVDFSEMAPRIRGWTVTGRGSTPSYTSMNVGTVVQITTRVLMMARSWPNCMCRAPVWRVGRRVPMPMFRLHRNR